MIAVTNPAPREPWWMRDLAGQPRFTVPFGCFDDYREPEPDQMGLFGG